MEVLSVHRKCRPALSVIFPPRYFTHPCDAYVGLGGRGDPEEFFAARGKIPGNVPNPAADIYSLRIRM